jgi:transposase
LYVGLDWGHEESQVHAEWGHGEAALRKRVPSTVDKLSALADELRQLAADGEVRLLIEAKSGLVVQTLLGAGVPVYATNPKQVDRARTLWGMADAKDDTRDSEVLAWMARCVEHAVHPVCVPDEWMSQARCLGRRHADLSAKCTAVQNQLSERLREGYPGALALSLDTLWAARVLQELPSPTAAADPTARATIRRILSSSRARTDADVVLTALRNGQPRLPEGAELFQLDVKLLAAQLELILQQRASVHHQLDALQDPFVDSEELSDVKIVRSVPGIGAIVAATLFGEGVIALLKANLETARAYTGVAPVRNVTGKRQTQGRPSVAMRRACNTAARNALHYAAERRMQTDPEFRSRYKSLRGRGHTHGRACRQLGDRLLKELRAMLRDRTLFEAPHPAA